MRTKLWAPLVSVPNTASVEAENVADLRSNRWLVVARRGVEVDGGEWQYVTGIERDRALFIRLRELDMLVMTQRRDGLTWTLLAKVASDKVDEWAATLSREAKWRGPR